MRAKQILSRGFGDSALTILTGGYYPATSGGSSSGTADLTLDALTLAASGKVAIRGTATIALDALSTNAAGVTIVLTYVHGVVYGPSASGLVFGPSINGVIDGASIYGTAIGPQTSGVVEGPSETWH